MHQSNYARSRIEDYALVGDCHTAALVGKNGSIDWLCLPRFDSDACFAALLGTPDHGRWLLAPHAHPKRVTRSYREGTLVLDTTFETDTGTVSVTDCMPLRDAVPHLVRVVHGIRGRVRMHSELIVRFEYGSVVPWVRKANLGIRAIAGPHMLHVQSDVPMRGENMTTVADFDVGAGDTAAFVLTWHASHVRQASDVDARALVRSTEKVWREWSAQCTYRGEWRDLVSQSLVTLKALTHATTGGIIAAPTTSLPEIIGGVRNWDYRYCWVRDATFTLLALAAGGYKSEARAWREWLLRAVAGSPAQLQIMYALDGGRRIPEWEVEWLPGYEQSRPVRVGNGASNQCQLDVYGELLDAMYQFSSVLEQDTASWDLQHALLEHLESRWDEPDSGIWEVRGPPRHFTHSKLMAWVGFDRGIKTIERFQVPGPLERWRRVRDGLHEQVCRAGFDAGLGAFVQEYGSKKLDASLLMIPLVGFLPVSDPRVRGTVQAIETRLMERGFVRRYETDPEVDGLPRGEGAFLPCSFWLADNWAMMGRHADARALFKRLVGLCNDVGLLSEEYDALAGRMLGNFPQAFSHVSLVNTAYNLALAESGPASRRRAAR